uniref:single-stranded DNA cytosine deaminase n=1 Tax=Felis catus TaxID=9685 RepID=A6MJH0_FELCA|nr:APOBEC3CH [Felis catus]
MEPWRPSPRNPMDRIDPNTFRFHFPNLLYASGRKLCYLCFQVETEDYFSCDDSDRGVFRNKVHPWARCHAEQCFLSWFRDQYPYRDEYYNVTWFLSWSPCPTCAEEVVEFLEEYRNLTLSIFTSRLYYFWDPNYQEGLCKLWDAGVQLDIMSCDDFKHCWDNFVDHKGMRFRRRNLLKGYDFLAAKLQEILSPGQQRKRDWPFPPRPGAQVDPRSWVQEVTEPGINTRRHSLHLLVSFLLPRPTMNPLQEVIFCRQFGNQHRVPKPYYRRKTYLCYQLKLPEGTLIHKDCLRNKKKRHAEMCFIDKIKALTRDTSQRFEIICYITWSPCPFCAEELVAFVKDNPHLSLRIFASRLYVHWRWKYQQGLRHLHASGIPVAVMSLPEFEDCWRNFVDHQDRSFQPWPNLDQYSKSIKRRLGKILTPLNDLRNDFRNLKLE